MSTVAISGIRSLIGKKMTKKVKFMEADVVITKLSVSQVQEIQAKAKNIEKDDNEGFNVLTTVIRSSVEDAAELADEDFRGFPLDELSRLSDEIMKFSGLGKEAGK